MSKYTPELSKLEVYAALIEIENGSFQIVFDLIKKRPSLVKLGNIGVFNSKKWGEMAGINWKFGENKLKCQRENT